MSVMGFTLEKDPEILLIPPEIPRSSSWSAGLALWISIGFTDISDPEEIWISPCKKTFEKNDNSSNKYYSKKILVTKLPGKYNKPVTKVYI